MRMSGPGRVRGHLLVGLAVVALGLFALAASQPAAAAETTLEFYTRPGCPRCVAARTFIERELGERSGLSIEEYDVARDGSALARLRMLAARAGIASPGVPAFAVGGKLLVGFDPDATPPRLRALIGGAAGFAGVEGVCELNSTACDRPASDSVDLPIVGEVSVERLGLPALYTAILTSRGLPGWEYYGYLGLYIAAYMLDDAILVAVGVVTLGKRKLQERGGRWLKLVSGLTIFGLGIVLLMRPAWLGF